METFPEFYLLLRAILIALPNGNIKVGQVEAIFTGKPLRDKLEKILFLISLLNLKVRLWSCEQANLTCRMRDDTV
jgi:hypothetical protein